jgi:hypothetical protein
MGLNKLFGFLMRKGNVEETLSLNLYRREKAEAFEIYEANRQNIKNEYETAIKIPRTLYRQKMVENRELYTRIEEGLWNEHIERVQHG